MTMKTGALSYSAAVISLALAACGDGNAAVAGQGEDAERRVVDVEVMEVAAEQFTEFVRVVGSVEANRDVMVSAEESGVIRAFAVERGAYLREGDPIARIDGSVLQAQLDQAEAEARVAQDAYERRHRLWEADGIGTESAVVEARGRAESAAAQLRVLRTRLARTVVRAPIGGMLESREVEVGSMVSPGTPVARLVDIRTVKVVAAVPERYAGQIGRGSEARVSLDGRGLQDFPAEIAFVGSAVRADQRAFPVEIRVDNSDGGMRPGMTASIRLPLRSMEQAVLVPQSAILRDEEGFIVYLARRGGDGAMMAVRQRVQTGPTLQGRVVVENGVRAGDTIVVRGQARLADRDEIQIVGGDR